MFKKLFNKLADSKEPEKIVVVPKSDPEYRLQQAKYYVRLLREPTVDPNQPIAFHAQLRVVTFDFSESSLDALDEILLSIRSEISDDFDSLVSTHSGLNLIVALGYYLGLSVAFLGKLPLAWIGYEEARKHVPSLPESVHTDLAALIGEALTFPANVVADMLFNPLPERTCVSYAKSLISGVPNTDKDLLGLSKGNALVSALHSGEMSEKEVLLSILDLAFYLPSPVSMQRKPPYAENWKPILAKKNGKTCQIVLTSLHFADLWKRAAPEIKGGRIVPVSWIIQMVPKEVLLGVNFGTDSEWLISPEAISHCKSIIENRHAAA